MLEHPGIGSVYKNDDAKDLAAQLGLLLNDRTLLADYKRNALALAIREFNWEKESESLLKIINKTILENN